jgi:hypothetical protein
MKLYVGRIERRRPGVFRSIDLGKDLEMIPEAAWSEQPSSKRQGKVAPRQLMYKYDGE